MRYLRWINNKFMPVKPNVSNSIDYGSETPKIRGIPITPRTLIFGTAQSSVWLPINPMIIGLTSEWHIILWNMEVNTCLVEFTDDQTNPNAKWSFLLIKNDIVDFRTWTDDGLGRTIYYRLGQVFGSSTTAYRGIVEENGVESDNVDYDHVVIGDCEVNVPVYTNGSTLSVNVENEIYINSNSPVSVQLSNVDPIPTLITNEDPIKVSIENGPIDVYVADYSEGNFQDHPLPVRRHTN